MKITKDLGMMVLAVWLIVFGLLTVSFLKIHFAHSDDVLAVLAIAAGALLLLKR
jgi:cell division protein FtsW (lipid II flippase)